jgi:hypothetical protein
MKTVSEKAILLHKPNSHLRCLGTLTSKDETKAHNPLGLDETRLTVLKGVDEVLYRTSRDDQSVTQLRTALGKGVCKLLKKTWAILRGDFAQV